MPAEAPGGGGIRRAPAEPRGGGDPLLEREADQLRLGPEAGEQAAPGQVAPVDRDLLVRRAPRPAARWRRGGAGAGRRARAGPSRSRAGGSRRVARPTTRSDRLSLAGASRLRESSVQPPAPGGAEVQVRHAHSSSESVCARRSESMPQAAKAASSAGRGNRQLAAERVVELLAALPEAGLHDPVERLAARPDRRPAARPDDAGAGSRSRPPAPARTRPPGRAPRSRRWPRSGRRPTGSSSGRAAPPPAPRPRPAPAARSAAAAAPPPGRRAGAGW